MRAAGRSPGQGTLRDPQLLVGRHASWPPASGFRARLVMIAEYGIDALCARAVQAGIHGVCVEHFLLSAPLVGTLRQAGLSVSTGTVNHPDMLASLLPLNLDAITSDRPHELRAALSHLPVAA